MRLSCWTFAANPAPLQLHAVAYNLGNFLWTVATPEPIKDWLQTSLEESSSRSARRGEIHRRYVVVQMAEGRHTKANVPGDFAVDREQSCQRETLDCHALKSNRQPEYV
jgi:hypothetical protein